MQKSREELPKAGKTLFPFVVDYNPRLPNSALAILFANICLHSTTHKRFLIYSLLARSFLHSEDPQIEILSKFHRVVSNSSQEPRGCCKYNNKCNLCQNYLLIRENKIFERPDSSTIKQRMPYINNNNNNNNNNNK